MDKLIYNYIIIHIYIYLYPHFSGSKFTFFRLFRVNIYTRIQENPYEPPIISGNKSSAGPSHAHGTAVSGGRAVGTVGLKVGWS